MLQVYNAKLSWYHFYHKDTTTRWGGVGFFIKESLSISISKEFDLNIPNCEDMWIQLDLGNNKKCVVRVIYRHPKQKLSEFCKSFESTIEKLSSRKLMYYIGGDFNADSLKSNSDINIKGFMNLTYSLGCIPLIIHPTRITTTSSTLLYHVYTNNVVGEHKSFSLVEDVSDHLPVMVYSNLSLPKSEKSTVTIRDTKNFEVEKFLDNLTEGMELLGDIKEECIDNYTEKFIDIFHETLNIHAPLRKQSRKETKLKNKPWLSKGILISIQQKNLLYKRALKLYDSSQWAQYKVYRNKLTHIKEYAKRLYIKNLVNENKHDTSSLWKILNKIIHLKNVKKNNIPNKMYASKSESAQGPQAISNLFNKYFIEIGVNLASAIETPAIIDGKFIATSF